MQTRLDQIRHNSNKIEPFKLTDIGEGIAEVEVIQWFVKEGDSIDEFDQICEVQSDKATVEIKSPKKGNVTKLYYKVGDMAKVGSSLIDLEISESNESEFNHKSSDLNPSSSKVSSSVQLENNFNFQNQILVNGKFLKVLATPSVRYIARKNNFDLSKIVGSGKDGRITKADLLNLLDQKSPSVINPEKIENVRSSNGKVETVDRVEKIKGYNRSMAKKMVESLSVPHFGYCDEINMNSLIKLRNDTKTYAKDKNIKLSFMPFIIKACSLSLKKYPIINSSINHDLTEITYHVNHNIGIAIDTPTGLVVPNIKNVQNLTIFEIASELIKIISLAQSNKLSHQDLTGGTFSLSNIGVIGGTYAKPVVIVPEVCIGAIGKIQKLPRYDEKGNVYPENIVQFSWSADHRVIDGATMANFSNLVKLYLENPGIMVIETK